MVRDLPAIRGIQVGLKSPDLVDQIKAQMKSGQFPYDEIGCRVIGVRDSNGTYHVKEGQIIDLLTGESPARGLSIFGRTLFADPPELRAGLLSIFRRPRIGDWLQKKAGISVAQASVIAKNLGLESNEQVCRLEGTPK